jgi:hypothetical protein
MHAIEIAALGGFPSDPFWDELLLFDHHFDSLPNQDIKDLTPDGLEITRTYDFGKGRSGEQKRGRISPAPLPWRKQTVESIKDLLHYF